MYRKGKFWLISEVFFPEETSSGYYLTEIAKYISQYQQVNIICGPISYEKKTNLQTQEKKIPENLIIHRLNIPFLDKNKLFNRILRLLFLTFGFTFKVLFLIKKDDQVLLVTNPAFLVPIAAFFSKIIGFRLYILVHDVFPENLIPINLLCPKSITFKILKNIFDKAYSSVDEIIVCGRDMKLLLEQKIKGVKKEKIKLIENWADTEQITPTYVNKEEIYRNLHLEKKIVFQFAGNIGRLQGLEQLLSIIKQCTNNTLHFVIIGEGALKNKLITEAKNKNISNISFFDSFNRNQQNTFLNACDVGLVSLYDSMIGLGVPSKTYNIMAAGKPILFLGNNNSEIGMVINEFEIGWQFELADEKKILEFLNNFDISEAAQKGKYARFLAENKYSKQLILQKYRELII